MYIWSRPIDSAVLIGTRMVLRQEKFKLYETMVGGALLLTLEQVRLLCVSQCKMNVRLYDYDDTYLPMFIWYLCVSR